jgi:hypothetical protein
MRDKDLYAQVLGIKSPWQVSSAELALSDGEVMVHVEREFERPVSENRLQDRKQFSETVCLIGWQYLRVHLTHVEILLNIHFGVAPVASMRFRFVGPNVSINSSKWPANKSATAIYFNTESLLFSTLSHHGMLVAL